MCCYHCTVSYRNAVVYIRYSRPTARENRVRARERFFCYIIIIFSRRIDKLAVCALLPIANDDDDKNNTICAYGVYVCKQRVAVRVN